MYMRARETALMSREAAAFRLHIGTRTLAYYESGERMPDPGIVLNMSKIYRQPDLTIRYCRKYCPIGQAYSYEILNNIDVSLPAVVMKLICELKEATEAARVLMELSINKHHKTDFKPNEWERFITAISEFIDVEHNIEILKLALEGLTEEVDLVPELVARHNQKCWEKGYIKEKAPAFARG